MHFLSSKIKYLLPLLFLVVVVFTVPLEVLAQQAPAAANAGDTPAGSDAAKGLFMTGIQGMLYTIVNVVFGWMVWAGGLLLNHAVEVYVVGFGNLYQTSGLGFSIDSLWRTVRDIFNLTFIFGLVFIGFKMILNTSDSNARRMLGSLVLAALLVNFSLFITKFIIDFSNIAAMQLAAGFARNGTYAISDGFMQLMGLSGLWNTGNSLAQLTGGASWAYIFGSMVLYLVSAFVFAAGGMLLIIRFVVLNIYMILSPIMFLGWVFPGFAGTSRDYWSGFLGRAFFAPAYILMLYFAYQVLVNLKGVTAIATGAQSLSGSFANANAAAATSFTGTIPFFIITCVFLIAALVVAQKMGAQGASTAMSIGNRASAGARKYTQKKAANMTLGAGAAVGQRTVGYGAKRLADNKKFQQYAARSWIGEKALKGTRAVADTSFDARGMVGVGTVKKGGYETRIKESNEADAKFAKSLGETKIEKDFDGNFTDPEIKKRVEAARAEIENNPKSKLNKKRSDKARADKAKEDAEKALAAGALSAEQTAALEKKIQELEAEKAKLPPIQRAGIESQIAESKKALTDSAAAVQLLKKNVDAAKEEAAKAEKELKEAFKEAVVSAESSVTYEKQLAFIAKREREANRWRSTLGLLTTGTATGTTAALGVGAGLATTSLATVLSVPIASSVGYQSQESVDNLRKNYGTDGTVAKKNKQKSEELKILSEQIKGEGDDKPEKKDDAEKE